MNQGFRRFFVFSCIAVMALSLAIVGGVSAQVISGDLVGTVFDKTGATVASATVEATNVGTGVKYPTTASSTGEYRISNLPIGTYNVAASSPDFATTTINGVTVELNKIATLQFTLDVKGAVTSIEVSGATQTLDTTTATVSSDFDQKQISDLPVSSITGGVLNLSLLSSGVASSGGVGLGTGPSVGGQRPLQNNFTIEGVDNNSKQVTGPLLTVPNDSVAEFTLLQNQFSPEFGHSTGGQFNQVIKSGTNQFHGLAYLYNQNRNYNAVDDALKNQGIFSNPRYDNNRIGGNIGGPVLKNKLFFFGSFEYNPIGQATSPGSPICSPTAAGYATLDSLPGLSATNLGILQKYMPAASAQDTSGTCFISGTNTANPKASTINVAGSEIPIGTIPIAGANFTNGYTVVASIDYDISTSDQIRGRYIYGRLVGIDNTAALPIFYLPAPTKNHLVTVNEYHTFNPTLTNEFRVGYNRFTNVTSSGNFQFPGLDSFPNIDLFDLGTQLGPDSTSPGFTFQNTYQMSDSITWTKGRHTLKFGLEGRKSIAPQQFTQRARGDYDYNNTTLFLQDIQPDFLAERTTGTPVFYGDQSALYWYANDSWRIRPNLTFNLGVRYQYTTIPTTLRTQALEAAASVPGLIDFSEPRAPKNEWAPRVGIAYSPGTSGHTSIRAGFGMGYDVLRDNLGVNSPTALTGTTVDTPLSTLGDPTTYITNYLGSGGIPAGAGGLLTYPTVAALRAAITSHDVVNQKDPESIQWNLGIQHAWKSYTMESRYLGSRGLHLTVQDRLNRKAEVTPSLFLPTYTTAPTQAALDALPVTLAEIRAQGSFVPAYTAAGFGAGNIVEFSPAGASTYHGLANQLTRRFDHGLQMVMSYTWSHLIDNSTADLFSTYLTPRRPQDGNNLRNDRGNSALDHRHRLTVAAIYDVPFFKDSNMFLRNTIGNWEIAPVYTYQSGEWFTAASAVDANGNGDSAGDRTILNAGGVIGTASTVSPLMNSAGATVAYLANNPTAQYIQAGAGALANVGRNTLLGRPTDNLDLTAVKRFSFRERYKIEFQAGAINVLNHPQFIPGSLNNVNVISTNGSNGLDYTSVQSTKFNNAPIAFASNARTLQLVLKIAF